jgi:hypothetical protein
MGAAALALSSAAPAFAQNTPPPGAPPPPGAMQRVADVARAPIRAPRGAFELGVEAGYTQGFGSVSRGRGVGDVAGAGATVGLAAGARLTPRWSLAGRVGFEGYGASELLGPGASVRGGSAGISGTFHAAPYERLDPTITLGTGYRALIESPVGTAPSTITHGFELGRLELGLDVRASESVAISPVIGADLSMFAWRTGGGAETAALTNKTLSTFVFAGVKGRFDLGGTREEKPAETVGRR